MDFLLEGLKSVALLHEHAQLRLTTDEQLRIMESSRPSTAFILAFRLPFTVSPVWMYRRTGLRLGKARCKPSIDSPERIAVDT